MKLVRWSLALLGLWSCGQDAEYAHSNPGAEPVVVELFTSQGCSSCPPADALFATLGRRTDVLALAFHVDYWDDPDGWSDPYSSPQYSARQKGYARSLGTTVFTPQVVVDGEAQNVGSEANKIAALIKRAQNARAASSAKLSAAWSKKTNSRWYLNTTGQSLGGARLFVALREHGLGNRVLRGENAARRLKSGFVVRALRPVGPEGRAELVIDPSWNASKLDAVVFAQHQKHGPIIASARVR